MQTTKWNVWANFRYLFVSLPQTLQLRNDLDTPYWRLEACSRQRACISDIIHGHEQSFWLITSKFVTGKVESLWAVWPRFGINAIIFSFDDRENRTRVGNYTSDWKAVKRGCPQGSSLGPLLWNVYQNDLFYTGVKSQLSAYADDHQIYCSNLNLHIAIDRIKEDGEKTSRWYKTNFVQGNYSKYKCKWS